MKKWLIAMLGVILLLGMSGCSGSKIDEAALDKYIEVSKNFKNIRSVVYDGDVRMDMDDIQMRVDLAGAYQNKSDDLEFCAEIDMAMQGVLIEDVFDMYITEDMLYIQMLDEEKQKLRFDVLQDMVASLLSTANVSSDEELKEALKEQLKEASLDGDVLTLVYDTDELADMARGLIDEELRAAGLNEDVYYNITYTDIVFTETLKDDLPAQLTMDVSMAVAVEDETITASVEFTMDLAQMNEDITLDFPSDLESYSETDISEMFPSMSDDASLTTVL